jgi:hypothetical protein
LDGVKILPHYTYRDYLHWEGKWEVIDGIPNAMSPAPAPDASRLPLISLLNLPIHLKSVSNVRFINLLII